MSHAPHHQRDPIQTSIHGEQRGEQRAAPSREGRTARVLIAILLPAILGLANACATTGGTFRSGVGERMLEHPPYYAGTGTTGPRSGGAIGHLPIVFQRGAVQPATFDPQDGAETPVARLLTEMNAYLDSIGVSVALVDGTWSSVGSRSIPGVPPDVRFGCKTESGLPGSECEERGDVVLGRGSQAMKLAVGRPSPQWSEWVRARMHEKRTEYALVITLEVGEYLIRQRGLRGTKVVELGSGYSKELPWLTSLETPVQVLQLTGALVDASGRALRIGAEGFHVRRTRLLVSAIGAQELFSDDDVSQALVARRTDLPGDPLAWQIALDELVARVAWR